MPSLIPHPFPGRRSPLFLATLLLIVGVRAVRTKEDDHRRLMANLLSIAATVLMTTNSAARRVAIVGGVMRLYGSTGLSGLGFLTQATSLAYAIGESQQASDLAEAYKNLPRP